MKEIKQIEGFHYFIDNLADEIQKARIRVLMAADAQMLLHYWKIGYYLYLTQLQLGWGAKVIDQIAGAIRKRFPDRKGYSSRNLKYMCQFAKSYPMAVLGVMTDKGKVLATPSVPKVMEMVKELDALSEKMQQKIPERLNTVKLLQDVTDNQVDVIGQEVPAQLTGVNRVLALFSQQPIGQIEELFLNSPLARINWAAHQVLMDARLTIGQRFWYVLMTIENGWSSNVLKLEIGKKLYDRQIKINKMTNFTRTLPAPHTDLADYVLKDPYLFDMMAVTEKMSERDVENQLMNMVTKVLLEMGNCFAFVARQKHLEVGGQDYYIDLLFYNIRMHAYVVIDLKVRPFKPEDAGKLNFYINVVNDQMKGECDNDTIGIILCQGKNEIITRYALSGCVQPIGVSDYECCEAIPQKLKSSLPTAEEMGKALEPLISGGRGSR